MSAQELLSHAYSQDGLCERLNGFVEPVCFEIKHGFSGLSLPGKEHTIGLTQSFCVVGEDGGNAESLHGIHHGVDVTGVVFYDCYIHKLTLILSLQMQRYAFSCNIKKILAKRL